MPVCGSIQPAPNQPLYFKSLKDIDDWVPDPKAYEGILKYAARSPSASSVTKGKLLVCHDYKGGYTESLFARSYTFNFWSACDTFVYFSHHRITIPPPGWITAAHRHGVKMLGTIIFEGGGEEDCLRLLVGKIPGQVGPATASRSLPLSPYYAKLLAEIARDRGFDGYLLNFECELKGSFEQTRALAAWITILQSEILEKVGPHGETVWYDSVVINGQLAWQDRLNSYNLPFFLSSSSIFSNYTWRHHYPSLTAQYFLTLDPALIGNTPQSHPHRTQKTLQDIYMGIDVWGRGSHGGGGFGCFKALDHISPDSLGLSVALFGMAWTWESEQDKPSWTWDAWWDYERKLWSGTREGETVEIPEMKRKQGEDECTHGSFRSIASFFPVHPPPDPSDIAFHTTFCPGSGENWFVDGVCVYRSGKGWTDIDKQTSIGDLLWPIPALYWDDERADQVPTAISAFCMDAAWNGGNSLRITISCPASEDELAAYRPVWLPIQSLSIDPQKTYEASIVYKLDDGPAGVDTEFALVVKSMPGSKDDVVCNVVSVTNVDLAEGWAKITIKFNTATAEGIVPPTRNVAIGLVVAIVAEDPSSSFDIPFLLGQLNVHACVPDSFAEEDVIILWANYSMSDSPNSPSSGSLTWDVATSFPRITSLNISSPEDPISAWNQQPTLQWFPNFLYFNIYAQLFDDEWKVGAAEKSTWIGTSGWDGQKNGYTVIRENLPFAVPSQRKVRLYVRGVNDHGLVMPWADSAYVDIVLP